jgi:hypothetical protein
MTALLLTFAVLSLIAMAFYIFAEEEIETQHTFTKRELRELVENGFYDDYFSNN